MNTLLEVCTGSLQSVEQAVVGGARRIELCSALPLDGLTPSYGMLQTVRMLYPQLTIHVLIRPREGNFVYSEAGLLTMERDIKAARPLADGIVVGALTPQGDIDFVATERLVRAAEGLPVTFHRAFDVCRNPFVGLEQLIRLGCRRVLTSGQQPTALQGVSLLRQLTDLAGDRLIVLPGGGVNKANARQIIDLTGTCEIHGSCSNGLPHTDAAEVRAVLASLAG